MVKGMYVREESVKFDDEDHDNQNSDSGKYPMGTSNGRNQQLLYCYYSVVGSAWFAHEHDHFVAYFAEVKYTNVKHVLICYKIENFP